MNKSLHQSPGCRQSQAGQAGGRPAIGCCGFIVFALNNCISMVDSKPHSALNHPNEYIRFIDGSTATHHRHQAAD
jgi:hypothetical protein